MKERVPRREDENACVGVIGVWKLIKPVPERESESTMLCAFVLLVVGRRRHWPACRCWSSPQGRCLRHPIHWDVCRLPSLQNVEPLFSSQHICGHIQPVYAALCRPVDSPSPAHSQRGNESIFVSNAGACSSTSENFRGAGTTYGDCKNVSEYFRGVLSFLGEIWNIYGEHFTFTGGAEL